MELSTKTAGFHKVRNLPLVETMMARGRGIPSQIDRITGVFAAMLICVLPATAYAQQSPADQASPHGNAVPDAPAPPAVALPSGNPQSGVLKPPDVDPKMAKSVPDVDPAMDNPPPGKTPSPAEPSAPKVQPK